MALLVDALVGDRLMYRPPTERSTTRVSALSRLRGRNTSATPTIEDRLGESLARSAFAVSQFEEAASELEAAAVEQESVAAMAQDEIDRLADLQDTAAFEAAQARRAAGRIRGLFAA